MKLMIFSGTTEGHDLCRFLSKNNVQAEVFVATEYGAAVMEPMAGITVHEGRLDEQEMEKRLTSDTLLIDATHPYAAAVTDNLRAACAKSGARYERLLRPALPSQNCERVLVAVNIDEQPYHAHFDARCGRAVDLITGEMHDFGGGSELPPYSAYFWKCER